MRRIIEKLQGKETDALIFKEDIAIHKNNAAYCLDCENIFPLNNVFREDRDNHKCCPKCKSNTYIELASVIDNNGFTKSIHKRKHSDTRDNFNQECVDSILDDIYGVSTS